MRRLFDMAEAANKRFPEGNEPFKIMTRLLEECGEVAKEVNHFENTGIKRLKYGEPNKEGLASEIRQTVNALFQLILYYNLEKEFEDSVLNSYNRSVSEGLIDDKVDERNEGRR